MNIRSGLPTGIDHVLVNGQVVIENGKHTGAKPGQVLYGPGQGSPVKVLAFGGTAVLQGIIMNNFRRSLSLLPAFCLRT